VYGLLRLALSGAALQEKASEAVCRRQALISWLTPCESNRNRGALARGACQSLADLG
jgi:hypothetical protein